MKNLLDKVIQNQTEREELRRELQRLSSQALSAAKRSIFSLQRDDAKAGDRELSTSVELLKQGRALVKRDLMLAHEGVWRAAQEEYVEAELFRHFVGGGNIEDVKLPLEDPEIVLGGLSDACGEMARLAVLKATQEDVDTVERLHDLTARIVQLLLHLDLTGSLRSKFDQAKQHLRKLEDVRYDLSRHV